LSEGDVDLAGIGTGMDNEWAQSFSMNFAPLAEPRNSDSMTALTAHAGQSPFGIPQDFAGQMGFAGQQSFINQADLAGQQYGNPPSFGGQQPFISQPGFTAQPFGNAPGYGGQQSFISQPGFTAQPFDNAPGYGGQQPFTGQPGFTAQPFDNPPGFGGQQPFISQPGFGEFSDFESQPGFNGQQHVGGPAEFGGQNQSFFPTLNQTPFSQQQNSEPLQPGQSAGAIPTSRPRWQSGSQQSQPSFSQDQGPHPNNGQFGQ